jgi:hypothetical protein
VCEGSQAFDLCCLATSIAQVALGSLPAEESVTGLVAMIDKASRKHERRASLDIATLCLEQGGTTSIEELWDAARSLVDPKELKHPEWLVDADAIWPRQHSLERHFG